MLLLCIGTKLSPTLISPKAGVAHQGVVGGALERTRHVRARVSNVMVPYSHARTVRTIYRSPSQQRWPLTIGVPQDRAKPYVQRGSTSDSSDIKLGCRSRKKLRINS